jgi:SAM-dependent methyltransferase
MDEQWPPLFRTGDRSTVYVRGDATRLPLKSGSASLAMSSFLLEHVGAWQEVVSEIARVSRVAFVAFGPNRAFPYEFGHIDAPLAHTLPAPLGAFAAMTWDQVSGNRRSYGRLREIIREMHWPSSRGYYHYCRERRLPCQDLFPEMMAAWAAAGGSRLRGWLAGRPALVRGVARAFSAVRLEPNIYSLIRQSD